MFSASPARATFGTERGGWTTRRYCFASYEPAGPSTGGPFLCHTTVSASSVHRRSSMDNAVTRLKGAGMRGPKTRENVTRGPAHGPSTYVPYSSESCATSGPARRTRRRWTGPALAKPRYYNSRSAQSESTCRLDEFLYHYLVWLYPLFNLF